MLSCEAVSAVRSALRRRRVTGCGSVRFREKVARQPERFALPLGRGADAMRGELQALEQEMSSRRCAYTRSDGSPWKLSLADVLERAPAHEVAYNPNDCVETPWGAPPRSEEAGTCRRHAPPDQAGRMRRAREWFSERRRPPR